jgi:hypothetical protein
MKNDEVNTKEGYLGINENQAYEWVKNGVWNSRKFKIWIDYVVAEAREQERNAGDWSPGWSEPAGWDHESD